MQYWFDPSESIWIEIKQESILKWRWRMGKWDPQFQTAQRLWLLGESQRSISFFYRKRQPLFLTTRLVVDDLLLLVCLVLALEGKPMRLNPSVPSRIPCPLYCTPPTVKLSTSLVMWLAQSSVVLIIYLNAIISYMLNLTWDPLLLMEFENISLETMTFILNGLVYNSIGPTVELQTSIASEACNRHDKVRDSKLGLSIVSC